MKNQNENSNNNMINNREEATLYQHCNNILEKSKDKEGVFSIKTGLSNIDATFQGLHAGKLYVLAGAKAMGKTLLAGQMALHIADHFGVLYVPLLESVDSVTNRLISAVTSVSQYDLNRLPWNGKITKAVNKKTRSFKTKRFFIQELWRYEEEELLSFFETYTEKENVRMIIIDDEKSLFKRMKKTLTTQEKYHFLLKLKMVFRNSGCCGVILKNIKPAEQTEENPYRLPSIKDFRTDYDLAELADEIWVLHRLDYYGLMKDGVNNSTHSRIDLYHMDENDGVLNTLYFTFNRGATSMVVLDDPSSRG